MEDKIEVGDYIRTQDGIYTIVHINTIFEDSDLRKVCLGQNESVVFTSINNLKSLKHSNDITDLIEPDDYVNGHRVADVYGNSKHISTGDIKTILTHEQYENMCYKVVN